MAYTVDIEERSTLGIESSPKADKLAGIRTNEARYFMENFNHEFKVVPAGEDPRALSYVENILKVEQDIVFTAKPLEVSAFKIDDLKFAYVFYEDGLVVNVMYSVDDPDNRAVGFKLSEGMEVPKELDGKFEFSDQKSTLTGVTRGSYFLIKGRYKPPF